MLIVLLLLLGGGLLLFCCGGGSIVGGIFFWKSSSSDVKFAQEPTIIANPFANWVDPGKLGPDSFKSADPIKPPANPIRPRVDPNPPIVVNPNPPGGTDPVAAAPKTYAPEQVYPLLLKSTVWIVCRATDPFGREGLAFGSGSLVDKEQRLVLTNYHVIEDAKSVLVFFPDTDANGDIITKAKHYMSASARLGVRGKVVFDSSRRDLALLQLDRLPNTARTLSLSPRSVTPGQAVYSIGASGVGGLRGLEEGALWRYTTGKVRNLIREFTANYGNGQRIRANTVETDSQTNPGDSGGPMVNDRMQLVAVVSSYNGLQRGVSMNIDVGEVRKSMKEHFASIGKPWKESDEALPLPVSPGEEDQPPAYWVKLLRHPQRGEQARERLVKLGAAAATDLRKMLADKDAENRRIAADVLGLIGDLAFEAVPELSQALTDHETSVRAAAAQALGSMGKSAKNALAQLLKSIGDPDAGVREAVAEAIKKIGPPGKEDAPKLAVLLRDPDPAKRAAGVNTLRLLKLDPDTAVSLFAPLLKDTDKRIRLEAIKAVCEAGKTARPVVFGQLLAMLDDLDADIRTAVMESMPQLGTPEGVDLPTLQGGLRGKHPEMRRYCATAIAAMGAKAANAIPFLARSLTDTDAGVRTAAATALSRMGPAAAQVVDDVLAARTDAEPAMRVAVLETLAVIGRKPGVVDAMFVALNDTDLNVRTAACKALQSLKPPPGKDDILQYNTALKSDKVDVRRFAAAELERLGADSAKILPMIVDAMKDSDPQVLKSIYGVIGAIGPQAKMAAPTLLEDMDRALANAAKDPEAAERFRRASVALGKIGQADKAVSIMRQALTGTNEALKKEVLTGFAAMGPDAKDIIPDLCVMLGDAKWQRPAAETLAKIGKPAVEPLLLVLDKKPKASKLGALDALARMKPEDAKDAVGDLYRATRAYQNEVGEAARLVLDKIQKGLPPKKN